MCVYATCLALFICVCVCTCVCVCACARVCVTFLASFISPCSCGLRPVPLVTIAPCDISSSDPLCNKNYFPSFVLLHHRPQTHHTSLAWFVSFLHDLSYSANILHLLLTVRLDTEASLSIDGVNILNATWQMTRSEINNDHFINIFNSEHHSHNSHKGSLVSLSAHPMGYEV